MTLSDFERQQNFQRHGALRGFSALAELLVYFMNGNLPTPDYSCTLLPQNLNRRLRDVVISHSNT